MTAQDEAPKSRITLTYKTEVQGEPAVVDLPLRLFVMGDFSGGSSKDRTLDLQERKLRSLDGKNTNEVMKDMGISVDMVVPNRINSNEESMRVRLSLNSLNSFSPEEVAKQIPQVRSLLLLKKLLEEIQSNMANKKEFITLLNTLTSNPGSIKALREKLKGFSTYQIPQKEDQNSNQPQQKED